MAQLMLTSFSWQNWPVWNLHPSLRVVPANHSRRISQKSEIAACIAFGGVISASLQRRTRRKSSEAPRSVPTQDFDELLRPPQLCDLEGKWALVSGASSGIGKAAACMLASKGCNVALLARRRERLEEIREALRCCSSEVKVIAGDVCADATYAELEAAGCLDVDFLINNAGLARGKARVGTAEVHDWKEMLDANCFGAFRLTNAVLPAMMRNRSGHVVMTGSIAGLEAYEGGSVYCATKHAVHAFMKALRYETYGHNIRCTTVAPGFVGEGTEFSTVRYHGDVAAAAKVYEKMQELRATDVAAQILWALQQPPHVCLDMMQVMPTCQGGATRVHRGEEGAS